MKLLGLGAGLDFSKETGYRYLFTENVFQRK